MNPFLRILSIRHEKEDFETVIASVVRNVEFSGTNLWILVFAIFIASLGLNVNSTAVVIGAMLISPLMGPIMGLGLGMAINDLDLLKKALLNYSFAFVAGLTTSTFFFLISPLDDASSEILARTSPSIYDVLIALFGGFAGILAVSSRQKGNVIPGVAIATALMPPLCTAGYGLANGNFTYLSGAIYLFIINTVFIALATLLTARVLKFPRKRLEDPGDEGAATRLVWFVVLVTLLPSIYFGYDIVKQNEFRQKANQFVDAEAVFPNDYLLKKVIDAKAESISLTYGGEFIPESEVERLRAKLDKYGLDGSKLEIKQGFAYLKNGEDNPETKQLTSVLNEKEKEIQQLKAKVEKDEAEMALGMQIFREVHVQYPEITSLVVQQVLNNTPSVQMPVWVAVIRFTAPIVPEDRSRLEAYLKARVGADQMNVYFEAAPPTPTPTPTPSPEATSSP
ncbi:MAG: DUF389 domain-containing protein [Pyrinomonadaceae bacterium]